MNKKQVKEIKKRNAMRALVNKVYIAMVLKDSEKKVKYD